MIVFIPGNVPSLKNRKVATSTGVFMSKTCRNYLSDMGIKNYGKDGVEHLKTKKAVFLDAARPLFNSIHTFPYPVKIGFHFVRGSRHKFDFHNAVQILADILVAYTFLDDDDCDNFLPYPVPKKTIDTGVFDFCSHDHPVYTYDKNNPGVFIMII